MDLWGTLRRSFGCTSGGEAAVEMHQIRYFLAVCEALNFTRAAEACNVSQPSLTRAIKGLEDELGVPEVFFSDVVHDPAFQAAE